MDLISRSPSKTPTQKDLMQIIKHMIYTVLVKITRKRKRSRSRSLQQSSLQKSSQITYKSTNPATCVKDLQINKLLRAEVNVSTPTNNRKSEVGRLKVSKGGRCLTSNDAIQELKDKKEEKARLEHENESSKARKDQEKIKRLEQTQIKKINKSR